MGIVLIVLFLFFFSLSWITSHGKNEKVPNIIGQNIDAATKLLKEKGFSVEVQDSVFVDSAARLSVIKQSPEADANVKAGRTVYLTVNRAFAPEVEMPSLLGFSIKSAQLMLATLNLKMGDTTYRPDIARNAVLEQLYNGAIIKPGTKIPMGSSISFVLGSGLGSTDLMVPDMYGLTVEEALGRLTTMNVNRGSIISKGGAISDTLKAYVIDQEPKAFAEPTPGQKIPNKIRPGALMDLFISSTPPAPRTVDTTKQNTTQTP